MTDNFEWGYFVLGLIIWQLLKMVALAANQMIKERRKKRFIRLVNISFPDRQSVTFVSVDSSDRRAFNDMEKELRELYDITQEELRRKA